MGEPRADWTAAHKRADTDDEPRAVRQSQIGPHTEKPPGPAGAHEDQADKMEERGSVEWREGFIRRKGEHEQRFMTNERGMRDECGCSRRKRANERRAASLLKAAAAGSGEQRAER